MGKEGIMSQPHYNPNSTSNTQFSACIFFGVQIVDGLEQWQRISAESQLLPAPGTEADSKKSHTREL